MKKLIVLAFCFLSSCGTTETKENTKPSKPLVIVSAAPYIEVVKQLAGDSVNVRSIIPPDVDPHNFEPSPRDMGPLIHANLWIQVGEEFEYLLAKRLKETNPTMEVLDLTKTTKALRSSCSHHYHGHDHPERDNDCHKNIDTHYWLDPVTVLTQAKTITEMLTTISPENKMLFHSNFNKLSEKLTKLNKRLKKELAPFHGDAFLTTHSAYGYFCHRYHLLQFGIEPDDGKEMRTKDIHHVLEEAYAHKDDLICVLTQPQHVNRAAETIGATLNLPLMMVNPYEEDYIGTINKLAEIVKKYGRN